LTKPRFLRSLMVLCGALVIGYYIVWRFLDSSSDANVPASPVADVESKPAETTSRTNTMVSDRTRGAVAASAAGVAVPMAPPQGEPSYHPRDPAEWTGMLVDLRFQPPCENSENCGLARACVEGVCTACNIDRHCARNEVCIWDHCLVAANVSCRTTRDCRGDAAACIFTGYSEDPRGNAEMKSVCVARGVLPPLPPRESTDAEASGSDRPGQEITDPERLLNKLRQAQDDRTQ
jgi:hypothetical protein